MRESLLCRQCKKDFRNGDFVAYESQDRLFHTIVRHLDEEPMSCLLAMVIEGDKDGAYFGNVGVYYNGRLYDYDEVNKLPNTSELTVDFNNDNNGDKLIGNLKELVRRKPFFPKLTLKEKIFGV